MTGTNTNAAVGWIAVPPKTSRSSCQGQSHWGMRCLVDLFRVWDPMQNLERHHGADWVSLRSLMRAVLGHVANSGELYFNDTGVRQLTAAKPISARHSPSQENKNKNKKCSSVRSKLCLSCVRLCQIQRFDTK